MTNSNDALRAALEWYRDQMCEGFCEGFTPRICAATMSENPTGGDCAGCRAVLALNQPAAPVEADPDFRKYVQKAGERLSACSADAPGSPTRDALVWINAALNPVARNSVPLDAPIAPNAHPPEPAASTVAQGEIVRVFEPYPGAFDHILGPEDVATHHKGSSDGQ